MAKFPPRPSTSPTLRRSLKRHDNTQPGSHLSLLSSKQRRLLQEQCNTREIRIVPDDVLERIIKDEKGQIGDFDRFKKIVSGKVEEFCRAREIQLQEIVMQHATGNNPIEDCDTLSGLMRNIITQVGSGTSSIADKSASEQPMPPGTGRLLQEMQPKRRRRHPTVQQRSTRSSSERTGYKLPAGIVKPPTSDRRRSARVMSQAAPQAL